MISTKFTQPSPLADIRPKMGRRAQGEKGKNNKILPLIKLTNVLPLDKGGEGGLNQKKRIRED